MKRINDILVCLVFIVISKLVFSQGESKDVSIIVTGSGKTVEEAKQVSLRNAIEQAYGVFISTKTEVLNDQVLSDEIISITSGNIKSYEILSQDQLPNDLWSTTLKTIVSVDKLTSFVQSKGISVEIKGGLFALNIKQQILNEQAEVNVIKNMIVLLHEPMQLSFDYSIKSGEPKALDSDNNDWEIPISVTAIANKNIDFCANYFLKTLNSISLTETEVESYNSLNKEVFKIYFQYNDVSATFYLRKKSSLNLIQEYLGLKWSFYLSLFEINTGLDEYNGYGYQYTVKNENTEFRNKINERYEFCKGKDQVYFQGLYEFISYEINFPISGKVVGVFNWTEKRNLKEIEQISRYEVKPRGVVSNVKFGGNVVYEENGHGLVMSFFNLGEFDWINAKSICDNLELNGFKDWYLPSKDELLYLIKNRNRLGLPFSFWEDFSFWSCSLNNEDSNEAWCINLSIYLSGVDGDNDEYLLSLATNRLFGLNDKNQMRKVLAFRRF